MLGKQISSILLFSLLGLPFANAGGKNVAGWLSSIEKAKGGDQQALRSVLTQMKDREGLAAAEFSMQLFSIFDRQPELVVATAKTYFAGNMRCLAYWLIPSTQEVEYGEVKRVFARAERDQNHPISEALASFSSVAQAYRAAQIAGKPQSVRGCIPFFTLVHKGPSRK